MSDGRIPPKALVKTDQQPVSKPIFRPPIANEIMFALDDHGTPALQLSRAMLFEADPPAQGGSD